jgi:hypothetical protein
MQFGVCAAGRATPRSLDGTWHTTGSGPGLDEDYRLRGTDVLRSLDTARTELALRDGLWNDGVRNMTRSRVTARV